MAFSAPIDTTRFQTLYQNYGGMVWELFRHAFPDAAAAKAAAIALFQNLNATTLIFPTAKDVLTAAYEVLARLHSPDTARRAVRGWLQTHRSPRFRHASNPVAALG